MAESNGTLPTISELVDLSAKTAIVTGGGRGIGRGIVGRLHEAGARVVVADVLSEDAARTADELNAIRSGSACPVTVDVSDEAAVGAMVQTAVDQYGSVDILVNNAGIFPVATVVDVDASLFRRVIDVNLLGVFFGTQAAARRMIEQGRGGTIINITSTAAFHAAWLGMSHYDASKHAVWGFTKNAALELGRYGIRVNAIAPGPMATPGAGFGELDDVPDDFRAMVDKVNSVVPLGRFGNPDELGRAALFLASDLASYMTGSQVVVDGGQLLTLTA
jgi:2-deoxy-D-gluconate 3-dehydrogenase